MKKNFALYIFPSYIIYSEKVNTKLKSSIKNYKEFLK
jgi:hypothetical protein